MGQVNIRDAALGDQSLRTRVLTAMKAAEAASSALEALTLSLAEVANAVFAEPTQRAEGCAHGNTVWVNAFGQNEPVVMCHDCGEVVVAGGPDERPVTP